MNVWKISSKIMVAVMLCASLLAAAIGGFVLHQSSKIIERNTYNNLELMAENYADIFSKSTDRVEFILNAYLSSISATFNKERFNKEGGSYLKEYQEEVLLKLTEQFVTDNEGILGIYFDFDPYLDENLMPDDQTYGVWYLDRNLNGVIERDNMELKKNFYPENPKMGWYYNAKNQKKGVWNNPYKDIYTSYEMISYNLPFTVDNQVIGVAGIDITFNGVMSIIQQFKVFETGYAFLLSEDYDVIVSPISEKIEINKSLLELNPDYKKLIDVIESGTRKNVIIGEKNDRAILSYGKMSNGYLVVIQVKENEVFNTLNQVVTRVDAIILFGTLISAITAYFLGKYIAKPVEILQRKIKRMAQLDFRNENTLIKLGMNNEGKKMIDEAEQVRGEVAGTIETIDKNLKCMELTLEQLDVIINKLEVTLIRLSANCENELKNDNRINKIFGFYIEESNRLINEAKEKKDVINQMVNDNQLTIGCFHLDDQ